eukprot:scaffold227_cov97-Cylindrotheca_fusiformis.AAC.2
MPPRPKSSKLHLQRTPHNVFSSLKGLIYSSKVETQAYAFLTQGTANDNMFQAWSNAALFAAFIALMAAARASDQFPSAEGYSSRDRTLERWPEGELNCTQGYREFNELTQKRVYYVGVHAPSGVETAFAEFNLTFETYLNEAVGKRWDPPIEFKMTASKHPLQDWIDRGDEVDFIDWKPTAWDDSRKQQNRVNQLFIGFLSHILEYSLHATGTMIVLADNKEIKSISDLKGKVIGAQSYSDFAGAQAQFYMMINNDNNDDTVQGVLDGRWDVGFVRTGHLERTINPATGDFVDSKLVRVLDPRIHVMDDGRLFPFLHSTPTFPEWALSAKEDADPIVSEELAQAMMSFKSHYLVGDRIQSCRDEATSKKEMEVCDSMPPSHFDPTARCDTTRELAELAYRAGMVGHHKGFRPPRSHSHVRTMQQDAGFIVEDGKGGWRCERDSSLYEAIKCPANHYKVHKEDFTNLCEKAGKPCPEGYACYCKPCVKAFEVSVFPRKDPEVHESSVFSRENGCDKMDVCGTVEQGIAIFFQAYDNLQRSNVNFTAQVQDSDGAKHLELYEVEPFLYEFPVSFGGRGVAIVEVEVDGVQIPESPFQVQVIPRNCDRYFPGQGRIPNEALRRCECPYGTIEIEGDCLPADSHQVILFPWNGNNETTEGMMRDAGCNKMSLCATIEQNEEITFLVYDIRKRINASVTALMHVQTNEEVLSVHEVEPFLYQFTYLDSTRGVNILEVFVDGVQIPSSPFRIEVESRDCDVDYPRSGRVANDVGDCECSAESISIGNKCVSNGNFAAIMASLGLFVAIVLGLWYIRYKRRKSDEVWHINPEELEFSHPVEVIGQGAFGVVLLADYHGTKVAIKRVLPLQPTRRARKTDSVPTVQSNKSGPPVVERNGDIEAGVQDGSSRQHTADTSSAGDNESSSDDFDFFAPAPTDGRRKGTLKKCLPFVQSTSAARSKLNVLGTASGGSTTHRSLLARIFPMCDENTRRQEAFLNEMRLLSRLRHPCITTIMGAIMNSHDPMMVMEYMENGSLYDLLRNETVYTGGEIILQIVRDIAQGLRFLHSSKPAVLHRDLKAKNILIDSRFRAKVADFGLSTRTKNVLSGMIIYEIYSRQIPYEGQVPRKVLRKVCDPAINYRPAVPGTCPKRMAELMKKCWGRNPSLRPEAKDLDMLFNDMTAHDAEPLVAKGNTRLRTEVAAGDMLYQVFPKKVADQLKAGQKETELTFPVSPAHSENHDNVTVFFSDIVRFTDISRALPPVKVCQMLDRLYLAFDALSSKHGVFKVETIGDAWVGVTNLEGNQNDSHTKRIAQFAVEAIAAAGNTRIDEDDPSSGNVHIRVGFHSGNVVSNVIGSLNPRYGLFGDTVNTASRMESLSLSDKIHCSDVAAKLLKEQDPTFPLRKRGKVAVKGKGTMTTYWVGNTSSTREVVQGEGGFDEKPVVGFKTPPPKLPKKVRGRPPIMIDMAGELRSPVRDDPTQSAPLKRWRSFKSKKKRQSSVLSIGSGSHSQ